MERTTSERSAQQTFTTVAAQYIALHAKSWKNSKHAAQWVSTLHAYAEPVIGPLCVREINATHMISVLEPIWTSKTVRADPNLTHPADPILTRGWSLTV